MTCLHQDTVQCSKLNGCTDHSPFVIPINITTLLRIYCSSSKVITFLSSIFLPISHRRTPNACVPHLKHQVVNKPHRPTQTLPIYFVSGALPSFSKTGAYYVSILFFLFSCFHPGQHTILCLTQTNLSSVL